MDEFKPQDELKPDTSDRRPTRSRKTAAAAKAPVSRQHMMMGVGILVLLLLIIGIGSALKGPSDNKPTAPANGGERNIDLQAANAPDGQQNASANDSAAPTSGNNAPQELSAPPIAAAPTQAEPVEAPQNQQRVTLPGDLNNALSGQPDSPASAETNTTLPVAPATVSGAPAAKPQAPAVETRPTTSASKPTATHKPAASKPETRPAASAPVSGAKSSKATPTGNYTLQLSGASRSDSLNAWAKKQNLSNYHVYKTSRNGQDWYVLVSGSYATPAEAKRAVASLPAEVRAQKPWVKPVSQVKKEAQK